MSRKRILNILFKEWRVVLTDFSSSLIIFGLPFLLIGQLMLYVWLGVYFAGDKAGGIAVFQHAFSKLQGAVPAVAALSTAEQFRVLLLNQFSFFLLLIPVMIAMNTVTFSIVDEKLSGSLEALLSTPVRTWELLLGKALAGAVPALLMTWIVGGVFLGVVAAVGWGNLIGMVVTPVWFMSLFLLTPAITVLSFLLGVLGSARAKDSKSAQNLSLVIIFPLFALIAVQVTGIVWFTWLSALVLAAVLIGIDYLVLRLAVSLFQRESIIVRWR